MSATTERPRQRSWTSPPDQFYQRQTPNQPLLEELFRSGNVINRSGNSIPLEVYIPSGEGELLYSLVRFLSPVASLEIGLANGVSALYIAQAIQDNGIGKHLAIDPFQHSDWQGAGMVTLERAQLDTIVSLDERPSSHVLPDLEQDGLRIQFAFVDGSHLFDYVMTDFLGIDRILDVGGMIAFDDSDWPAVTSVIRFAITNRSYEVFPIDEVIEPSRFQPRLASRCLRFMARKLPSLGQILRHDFAVPTHSLGIKGRLVVLRKLAEDQRDSQSQHFFRF